MSAAERLRTLAGAWDEWGLGGTLAEIADQIERELREERDRYVRKRQRLLGHIAECETALGRRREIISKLGHRVSDLTTENAELRRRAMPEGMEWLIEAWPKFEDDAPVKLGDEVSRLGEVFSISLYCDGSFALNFRAYSKGERARRPAVLAADGEPLEVGQTVWGIGRSQHEFEVLALNDVNPEVGNRFSVKCFDKDENEECWCDPKLLTHTKPEIDTWERIEADCAKADVDYCDERGLLDTSCNRDEGEAAERHCIDCGCTCGEKMARDLVRRCRALAERERGE